MPSTTTTRSGTRSPKSRAIRSAPTKRFAAVGAANLANSDHMAEEEREGLTDFRRLAGLQRRHQLAVDFAAFEARNFAGVPVVDRDPAT